MKNRACYQNKESREPIIDEKIEHDRKMNNKIKYRDVEEETSRVYELINEENVVVI